MVAQVPERLLVCAVAFYVWQVRPPDEVVRSDPFVVGANEGLCLGVRIFPHASHQYGNQYLRVHVGGFQRRPDLVGNGDIARVANKSIEGQAVGVNAFDVGVSGEPTAE